MQAWSLKQKDFFSYAHQDRVLPNYQHIPPKIPAMSRL